MPYHSSLPNVGTVGAGNSFELLFLAERDDIPIIGFDCSLARDQFDTVTAARFRVWLNRRLPEFEQSDVDAVWGRASEFIDRLREEGVPLAAEALSRLDYQMAFAKNILAKTNVMYRRERDFNVTIALPAAQLRLKFEEESIKIKIDGAAASYVEEVAEALIGAVSDDIGKKNSLAVRQAFRQLTKPPAVPDFRRLSSGTYLRLNRD